MLEQSQGNCKSRISLPRTGGLFWVLILVLAAGGCNLPIRNRQPDPQGPGAGPTQDLSLLATLTQQAVEKGDQQPTAAPTATQAPTLAPSPTWTPEGAEPLPSSVEEIKFRLGGTIAYLQGDIAAGQAIEYTFDALGGQTLIAGVSSEDQDVFFEIKGSEDGSVLASFSEEISSLTEVLPSTQTYRITLTSKTDNTYFLSVEIPAILSLTPGAGPVSVDGYVDVLQAFHPNAFTRVRYLLKLEAGTVLNVQLSSPGLENLTLALIGADDGVPYLRHVVKSDAINNFPVPVSQAYYLDVYDTGGVSTEYNLELELNP